MGFCTVVNCMDGRVQLPVIRYMQQRFNSEYVDTITEPGPIRILAEGKDGAVVESILKRINVSTDKHKSSVIAVAGHYDCAGNPLPKATQLVQINESVKLLKEYYPEAEIIGLWINERWEVEEVL